MYKELLNTEPYKFLKENEHLGDSIMFLTLSGSRAYGTNLPTSDTDIRGIAVNGVKEVLGITKDFEQVVDIDTDTVVYSLSKMIELLLNCNPNTIELLGTKDEHILFINKYGKQLRDNRKAFLSQRAIRSFGGYANAQLNRLKHGLLSNGANDDRKMAMMEQALKHSLDAFITEHTDANMQFKFRRVGLQEFNKLYPNWIENTDMVDEHMLVSLDCRDIEISEFKTILDRINNIRNDYSKLNKEFSKKKIEGRLSKHMMHLVRLYLMAIDLNEKAEIITYRDDTDHELLMSIRNGEYLTNDGKNVIPEFWELLDNIVSKYDYSVKNTILPERPNTELIEQMVIDINRDRLFNR